MAISLRNARSNPLIQRVHRHANMTMLFRSAKSAAPTATQFSTTGGYVLGVAEPSNQFQAQQAFTQPTEPWAGDSEQSINILDSGVSQTGRIESVASDVLAPSAYASPTSPTGAHSVQRAAHNAPALNRQSAALVETASAGRQASDAVVAPVVARAEKSAPNPLTAVQSPLPAIQRHAVPATQPGISQPQSAQPETALPGADRSDIPQPITDGIDDRTWSRLQGAFNRLKEEPARRRDEAVQRQTSTKASDATPLFGTKPVTSPPVARRRTQIIEAGSFPPPTNQPQPPSVQRKIEPENNADKTEISTTYTQGVDRQPNSVEEITASVNSDDGTVAKPALEASGVEVTGVAGAVQLAASRATAAKPITSSTALPTATLSATTAEQAVANQAPIHQPVAQRSIENAQSASARTSLADSQIPVKEMAPDVTNFDENDRFPSTSEVMDARGADIENASALPLQAVWPVQRVAEPASSAQRDAQTELAVYDEPVAPASEAVRQQLEQMQSSKPTESKIDIVMPRRPRPVPAPTVAQRAVAESIASNQHVSDQPVSNQPASTQSIEAVSIAENSPIVDVQLATEINTKKKEKEALESQTQSPPPTRETPAIQTVRTSIGSLPADLWTLIGEPVPASEAKPGDAGGDANRQAMRQEAFPVANHSTDIAQRSLENSSDIQPLVGIGESRLTTRNVESTNREQSPKGDQPIGSGTNIVRSEAISQAPPIAYLPSYVGVTPVHKSVDIGVPAVQRQIFQPSTPIAVRQQDNGMDHTNINELQSDFPNNFAGDIQAKGSDEARVGQVLSEFRTGAVQSGMQTNIQRVPAQHTNLPAALPLRTEARPSNLHNVDSRMMRPVSEVVDTKKAGAGTAPGTMAEIKVMKQSEPAMKSAISLADVIQRATEPTASQMDVPQTSSPTTSSENGNVVETKSAAKVDIDALARAVYRQLGRKLSIERERLR